MKHTKGPWVLDIEMTDDKDIESLITVEGPCGRNICASIDDVAGCDETDRANARLIAAAPEMLEALESLISMVDQHTDDTAIGADILWAINIVKKAKGGA